MNNLVSLHGDSVVTTSLQVAEFFGKQHKNVLSGVRSLKCSPEFTELNFKPSEYLDDSGRKLLSYEMTKDGFIFLVMGYTGEKAALLKEAYIAEFNRMAAQLSGGLALPSPEQEAENQYLQAELDEALEKNQALTEQLVQIQSRYIAKLETPPKRRAAPKPLTERETQLMVELKEQGMNNAEIARKLGRSAGTVSMITRFGGES